MKKLVSTVLGILFITALCIPVSADSPVRDLKSAAALIEQAAIEATEEANEPISEPYPYPIVPGTPQWEELESRDEMMEVCQIPERTLKNMTTEALAQTVIDHPMLSSIMLSYEDLELGFQHFAEDFNGAQELLKREDAAVQLAKIYAETPVLNQKEYAARNTSERDTIIDLFTKEAVLAVPQVFGMLDENETAAVAFIANEKMVEKIENEEIYGTTSNEFFAARKEIADKEEFLDIIDREAVENCKYIQPPERVVMPAAATITGTVKTPKGTSVSVFTFKYDLNAVEKNSLNNQFKLNFPRATYLSTATNQYNCHSYSWHSSSTSNKYWMDSPEPYMNDGSYGFVPYNWMGSHMIMYWDGEHSGNIISGPIDGKEVVIESKWGQGPLMRHGENYSPYKTPANRRSYWYKKMPIG